MRYEQNILGPGFRVSRPLLVRSRAVYGEKREFAVRPPDRNRPSLIADACLRGLPHHLSRLGTGPVQRLPVHRMEARIAPRTTGSMCGIPIPVPARPIDRVGECANLLSVHIDGMVHDMRNTEGIAQFMRPDLKILNGLRGLQTLQQFLELFQRYPQQFRKPRSSFRFRWLLRRWRHRAARQARPFRSFRKTDGYP